MITKNIILKLKIKIIYLCFIFTSLNSIQLYADEIIDDNKEEAISIVIPTDNAPFSFELPDGNITGLYVEFWNLWSSTNNIPVKFISTEFEAGISLAKNNKIIHSGLFINEERSQWADFSVPIHQVETGLLYNNQIYNQKTLINQQHDIIVSTYAKSYQSSYLKSNYPKLEIIPFKSVDFVFDQLINGEIQAIVAEIPLLKSELTSRKLNGVLTLSDEILLKNKVYAVIKKGQPELLKMINKGIENISIKSLIDLESKWLPSTEPYFKEYENLKFLTLSEKNWLMNNSDYSMGVDTSWYPFDFADENGDFTGIASDYVAYVSSILNIKMTPVKDSTWLESLNKTKKGEVDIMAAAVSTELRKKSMYFTDPYFSAPIVIVTNRHSFYAKDMTSLFGKTLGVVNGFSLNDWIKEEYPEIKFQLIDSILDGLKKVDANEIDAYIGSIAVINYEIEKWDLQNIQISAFLPYEYKVSFAVRKGLEPLVGILNKVLSRMTEKQKTIIANNWLAVHIENGTKIKFILLWALPIITILSFIIIFITRLNNRLKIEVLTRKEAEKELEYLAHHDDLTGLINWRMFNIKCSQKMYKANPSSDVQVFLFLDIDGFKEVNDNFGHKTGDNLMIAIASRLNNCLEPHHEVARVGGDEFVIYLGHESNPINTKVKIKDILKSLSKPYNLDNNIVKITASIGVSHYPENGTDTETLTKNADTAMYEAKKAGKNTYKYYINE